MRTTLHRRAVAAFVAASLLAAACSDDDEGADTTAVPAETTATTSAPAETTVDTEVTEDTEPAAATTSTWAPNPEPLKIGTAYWTLPQAGLNTRLPAIQAAVNVINEAGGIHGRQIEWQVCTIADPNEGDACARKFVEDGVVATIGDANLLSEVSYVAILDEAGIPMFDPFVNSPEALNSANVFLLSPGTPAQYAATVEFMNLEGVKSLHFMSGATSQAANTEAPVIAAAEEYGIEITGRTEIPLSTADASPIVADAYSSGAEAYVPVIPPFMTDLLMQSMEALGYDMRIAVIEGQFTQAQYETYGQPGGPLDGALLADTLPPITEAANYPDLQRALDEIDAYYEETGDELAAPEVRTTLQTRAWFTLQAFAKVADAVEGDITREAITEGLNTMTIDLGLLEWTPSTVGPEGYTKVSNPYQYLSTLKDGELVLYQTEPVDSLAAFR